MDCRFFLPHFSILCKQISDFRFWKNGCIFHNMQPDCVCKARFFSKNVLISAKKMCRFQAIFAVFHRLSEDFQQCFPQPVEKSGNADIWGYFRCWDSWKLWKTQKIAYLLAFYFHRLLKMKLKVWIFGKKPEKRTEILWKMGMIFRKMWKNWATFPQKAVKSLGKRFKICRTLFFLRVEMSVFSIRKQKAVLY